MILDRESFTIQNTTYTLAYRLDFCTYKYTKDITIKVLNLWDASSNEMMLVDWKREPHGDVL